MGQVERPSFDGLVLFLVLTCYITLENKNISKIIYNIYIYLYHENYWLAAMILKLS